MGSEVILEIEEKSGPSPRLFSEMLEYVKMSVEKWFTGHFLCLFLQRALKLSCRFDYTPVWFGLQTFTDTDVRI